MYKLGWFSTGKGNGSRELLKAVTGSIKSGEIKAEIAFVFCSREPGESEATDLFLRMVEDYHIPLVCFSYQQFKAKKWSAVTGKTETLPQWRLDYDREIMTRLQDFHPDLCVLAGYMLIVGKEMCRRYDMINLHPAAPGGPKGTWQEVIWQLIEAEAEETGIIIHLATPEMDEGPPVTYCTFPLRGKPFDKYWDEIGGQPLEYIKESQGENNNLFRLIREHSFARELPLLVSTIKAFSQGKVKITPDKKVTDYNDRLINGYDLTNKINEVVKGILPL
ncbi:phosphoribosylglycinamide formyltransferase [Chloroflexota bacterium]